MTLQYNMANPCTVCLSLPICAEIIAKPNIVYPPQWYRVKIIFHLFLSFTVLMVSKFVHPAFFFLNEMEKGCVLHKKSFINVS